MIANDASSTPQIEETIYVAFLKDLDAAVDPEKVIRDYAERHPHLADELREMAKIQRKLDQTGTTEQAPPQQPAQLGDFRIIRPIAEGGMGTIYEAIQEPLGRQVAVKTIRRPDNHLTGALQARFLREQKVLARLHHTHIVPIHAAGQEDGLQYFAMSYIDGAPLHHVVRTARLHESSSHRSKATTPSLAALAAEAKSNTPGGAVGDRNKTPAIARPPHLADPRTTTIPNVEPVHVERQAVVEQGPMLPENGHGKLTLSPEYFRSVARVMIDAAEAVQHAHEAGIIHRDLKPSNLMVDTSEHCWVLDFGLAGYLKAHASGNVPVDGGLTDARAESSAQGGAKAEQPAVSGILGTPHYMAPESFQGRADERTDVWGMGVILYELLTLRRPFDRQKDIETSDPPRPRDLVHGVLPDLEAICWKAIRREPSLRYTSARALADDLRHWLRSEPVNARPAHTLRRLLLWANRNKGWAAAITVGTLTFIAVSVGAIHVNKTHADSARALALAAGERQLEAEGRAAAEHGEAQAQHRAAQTQQREALIQQMQRIPA